MTIYLTEKQRSMLAKIDILLSVDSVVIDQFIESEMVVQKLADGRPFPPGPLTQLVNDNQMLTSDILFLRNEVTTMRADMTKVIRAVSQMYDAPRPYSQDLTDLKNRYSAW